MIEHNEKISIRQLQILLIFDIFGTGIIVLPRKVALIANQDGWILIIGATFFALLLSYMIVSLALLFPSDTFVEISKKLFTKPVGVILSLVFAFKFALTTGFELKILGEIIKQTMLPNTPSVIVTVLMLLCSAHVAYNGYECRARLAEILIFVAFVPLVLVFVFAAFDTDFTNLMPFFKTKPETLIKGSMSIVYTFSGIEFLLLATPFINNTEKEKKEVAGSILVAGALLLIITVITLARFGEADTTKKLWPVLQMMDTIDLPGSFIERQDVLVMSFWIISVFAIVTAGIFFVSLIFSRLTHKRKQSAYVKYAAALILLISIIPENIAQTYLYLDIANKYLGTFFIVALPLTMIIFAKLRKRGVENERS